MLWHLIWTVSSRRFRWGVTTYGFDEKSEKLSLNTPYLELKWNMLMCLEGVVMCCMLCLVFLQIIDPISLPATPNFPASASLVSLVLWFVLFLSICISGKWYQVKWPSNTKVKSTLLVPVCTQPYLLLFYSQICCLACLDEVQKSLCTTPGIGVGIGVHIYISFLTAHIF